jgi:hypothetical protein
MLRCAPRIVGVADVAYVARWRGAPGLRAVAPLAADPQLGRCEELPNRGDDEPVVFDLRQPRHGDRPDDADAVDVYREAAARGGKLLRIDERGLRQRPAVELAFKAQRHRAASEAQDRCDLSLNPRVVVRRRSGQAGVEQLMAAPTDIDRDRQLLRSSGLDEHAAEPPRVVEVEAAETQLCFFCCHLLQRDAGWIVSHRFNPSHRGFMSVLVHHETERDREQLALRDVDMRTAPGCGEQVDTLEVGAAQVGVLEIGVMHASVSKVAVAQHCAMQL